MTSRSDDKIDRVFLYAVFGAALVANLILSTHNWTWGFLIGHEFRQSQTALISYYIEQQNNFSLHYQTPILGKPWEFPLEFPLYEWAVVLLSRLTHWPHFESARAVSLSSVYLALPAVYLLLGQAGLTRPRRLLVLALVLATPVYLFYGRTFLMDTMAMMFSAWFLAAFVQTMRTRTWRWLLLCTVAGTAAALVKSLTFFVWVIPAAGYGAWCVWRDLRAKAGPGALARTLAWGFATVIVPGISVSWWVRFTDAIKENHASAYIFTSKGLLEGNYGMYQLSSRLSKETWRALLDCWSIAIAQPWIIGLTVVGGVIFCKTERWRVLGAFGLFIAAQMMFPYAYAYQDYYFTACAVFGVVALGFALVGVFGSGLPRWCRWPIVLLPFVPMYAAYAGYYYHEQAVKSSGGTGLTIALRNYLPKDSVIIVAGADWAAIIPYYSEHRALMIRNGLENDPKYLERAFNELADEDVSALVLTHAQRGNRALVQRAAAKFTTDSEPTFSYTNADVYVSSLYRANVLGRLKQPPLPEGVTANLQRVADSVHSALPQMVGPATGALMFKMVKPAPWKFRFAFGYGMWTVDGEEVLNAHPEGDLWVKPNPGAREVTWLFGMRSEVYEKTGGADFVLEAEAPDGTLRPLFSRFLDPAKEARDRGLQTEKFPVEVRPGESLVFRSRPHGGTAFDWCYWKKIDVR